MSLTQIESEALKLTEHERAFLAERLLDSLGESPQDFNEERWIEEAERRYREYKAGRMAACPAEDVFGDAFGSLE